MARIQFTLNHSVLQNILQGEEVMDALKDAAYEIIDNTGMPDSEYEVEEWVGQNRARVSILTVGWPAHAREARDHNLVRALGSVHGG